MIFEDVVDADDLDGDPLTGFANAFSNSPLFTIVSEVDANNNVDLRFTRVAFDEALGEGGTRNQRAVAGAIEEVYEEVLENPGDNPEFAGLVSNIFALGRDGYPLFLDQLAGAEYPQHLQSVLWSTRTINRIVGERMECSGASSPFDIDGGTSAALGDGTSAVPVADAPSEEPMASSGCFDREKVQVWVRGFGSWNELDGDREAPGFDESQYGVIFGADYSFTESWFLGIAGGYFDSNGDFDSWGGRRGASIDYDGLQLAAYGGYDNSVVYARGVLAYGNYDGDSERDIYIPDLVSGRLSGDPSSDVLSFYGEAGYRFDISSGLNLTPYAGVTLARANLDGFTEKDPDGTGAALSVHDSDAESFASVLGLRLDGEVALGSGTFLPELSVAWSHEFGDTYQSVKMDFADGPPGASFTAIGSDVSRDALLVSAGTRYLIDYDMEIGLFYNGWFSGDYMSNAVTARFGYKF
jgi:outer membrane autotransporter protein